MSSPRPAAASTETIKTAMARLSGWELRDGKLYKKFEFADFAEAMGFMVRAISHIEKANHHPEWFNVYNRVEVCLQTHEVLGSSGPALTELDFALAAHLNLIR